MKNKIENSNKYDPRLPGNLNKNDEKLLEEFGELYSKIAPQLDAQPLGCLREASIRMCWDITALYQSIITLLRQEDTFQIIIAALIRSLIDCCVSIFVFCKDPQKNAELYHNFLAVHDWIVACKDQKHQGCPIVSDSQEEQSRLQKRKAEYASVLKKIGMPYTNKKSCTQEELEKALEKGETNIFRNRWHEEKRDKFLKNEGMEWVYDLLYSYYSSATHTDPAGSVILGVNKSIALNLMLILWGAGVYRLAKSLNICMDAEHENKVKTYYEVLKGKFPVTCKNNTK